MASAENFASTNARAFLPKRARISASPAMRVRASASASALSTGKVSAVSSRMAISRQPGVSVAIIGRPQAAASSRLFGRPSRREASTAMCGFLPHLADIGDVAEPANAEGRGEFAKLLGRERSRIFPVGIAGKQKLELHPARGGERIGLDQRDHALVGEHAPDIGRGDGRRRLGQRHEMLVSTPDPGIRSTLASGTPRPSTNCLSSGFCTMMRLPCRLSRALSAATTSGRVSSLLR